MISHHFFVRIFSLLALCLACFCACKGLEANLQDDEVDYLKTARQNFEAGQESFDDEKYSDAELFFGYVKNKFPYSKYAPLAELRMADAHFEQENWLEAADAYRLFIRFHPRHEEVAYASYRVALSFWYETAGTKNETFPFLDTLQDWLSPFPPVHERDLSATRDAIASFDEFILRHPENENVAEAKALRVEARTFLAAHEMYAAEFYIQRKEWRGAMWRYETIATNYSETPQAPAAMLRGGEIAMEELDDLESAKRFFSTLVEMHPDSAEAQEAQKHLSQLPKPQVEEKEKDSTKSES